MRPVGRGWMRALAHLAGQQALEEGLTLVAMPIHEVLEGDCRLVCEGPQVVRKVVLYHACTSVAAHHSQIYSGSSASVLMTIEDDCPCTMSQAIILRVNQRMLSQPQDGYLEV